MANVNKLAPFILKWEGGFVNDLDDLGGDTNMGVTIGTYGAYCRKKGYPKPTVERLKNLTKEEWTEILKTMYWDRWKADEIESQSVANILVDWVWASGVYGIKIPQQFLGVDVDGIVGPKTIATLNSRDPRELFDRIKIARFDFIEDICQKRPANNKFKRGWMNRINNLTFAL
ncbi:peptidoglycan domain protein [Bacteroides intestinalis]|uniref:Peptidoglycan domain protein n=1 Tax=Bacteroides intestinalis TaxID=329854 RepID=A0A412XV72_9BACE|nr:glycosyl hydrolase 108 family protein [Bacteroides intestinalis]RGV49017.1 peptidoglycan domain protein [Bacteroides intestinalis]